MKTTPHKLPFAVLLIACLCAAVACQWLSRSPSSTVVKFYEAVAKGKHKEAKQFLDPAALEQMPAIVRDQALAAASSEILDHGGLESIQVEKETVQGDNAQVQFVIRYKDGSSKKDKENLIRKNRKWFILVGK